MSGKIRALGLLSGGLDSALAVKLMLEQGIEVVGVKFTSPFCSCDQGGRCFSREIADDLGIEFIMTAKGNDYLKVVRNPRFGYGRGMNPCIDCRIYMLRKAWDIARGNGARFIITGDVLGQRPMSQHRKAFGIIENESGLRGMIVRPLSALHLPETVPEREGWIDRSRMLALAGRQRREQFALAEEKDLDIFACPAGGCLLTDAGFARKLRDLFAHTRLVEWRDVMMLKTGRHFRFGASKIIVGRNEDENRRLALAKRSGDYILQADGIPGPVVILQGSKSRDAVVQAARLAALYSDARGDLVAVRYGKKHLSASIVITAEERANAERHNVVLGMEDAGGTRAGARHGASGIRN